MQKQAKEIRYFLYSQAFADGLRASFAILLPALIGAYTGYFETGLTISLGAMCTSLTDAPGPIIHKRNGMLICAGFAFVIAVLTAFAQRSVYTMGLEVILVSFFFSMFNVYGNRATSVGNAAILIMILTMDKPLSTGDILPEALLIFGGSMFYLIISLLLYSIRPYRIAQRALGDCIREVSTYLSIKADFYNKQKNIDANYRRLVAQQIVVNEKQDAVREIFFKTRKIVQESTKEGRKLLLTFVETIDLFEDITAAYYDYDLLRNQFGDTGALDHIGNLLKKMAGDLDGIGIAIQTGSPYAKSFDYDEALKTLKTEIDILVPKESGNSLILRKILVNLRKMLVGFTDILQYFDSDAKRTRSTLDHSHFVSHQSLDPRILWNNLSFQSAAFRHSLRVVIACTVGFTIAKLIAYGHHSYWILLTIAFILKPAFSLTKQRNIERIIGTLAGGAIGILILLFIPNKNVQFVLMVLFMIGTYSFMRINYLVMVIFTTPYVLILFSFLGSGFKVIAQERIFDTVTGCAIAFSASYFLFPHWESDQLKSYLQGILKANAGYLQKIVEALSGHKVSMLEYKLARKKVYLNSANLSAAFQRMLSEPKSKQRSEKHIHQFVVLNHILFSNIATVATTLLSKERRIYPPETIHLAGKAYKILYESSKKFGEDEQMEFVKVEHTHSNETASSTDDLLLKEQLNFINKVSMDIDKTTNTIIA
jgi:uncharacterized membrane protein (TIGR01666 family)